MANDSRGSDLATYWAMAARQVLARLHLVRYVTFAALAIAVNLLAQATTMATVGEYWFGIYAALAFGNGAGLVFKYIADKYWVFQDNKASLRNDSCKFAVYAAFGLGTTFIFWGVELAFHHMFQSALMTNVGAVLGLSIGYVIKYNLDKNITFAAVRSSGYDPAPNIPLLLQRT